VRSAVKPRDLLWQGTDLAKATIRVFAEDDVPAVAALFARVYPDQRWSSQAACESYFREMLFDNPWRDLDLPSWVAEERGRIIGFQTVMPRPMLFRRRPIRVAVSTQFMVEPERRHGFTALQLIQACLSGPQDLTLADGATDLSQRIWKRIGGAVPLLYNVHWTRPLRPARYALSLLEGRAALPPPLTFAARPLAALADAVAARLFPNRFLREETELAEDVLDPATMLAHLPDATGGNALQPVYDSRSLAWLLDQTARKTCHGRLRARAVYDGGRLIGWYLYYVQAGGVGEVVQIAARQDAFDRVLQRLLADAWRHGVTAVRGRIDPRYVQELSNRHCWCRWDGTSTLVHSRHPDVMAAIHRGDAFLSRLEGEWWMRFQDAGGTKRSGYHASVGHTTAARPISETKLI
jgi:hypothetical protein